MNKIGIGVIGCGSISWLAHFPSIAKTTSFELVGVCDTNEEYARRAASHWGGTPYTSYQDLLKDGRLQALIIASPNSFHFEHVMAALDVGLHVYVEKPMCSTNTQAWTVVERAKQLGLRVTVGCNQRFWLQHEWAKELIDAGVIGEVKLARSSLHETWRLYQENVAMSDFRLKPEQAVSGTLFDQGSHRVDLTAWLIGYRPTRVVGVATNVANPSLEGPLDDMSIVVMEFEHGAYGVVTTDKFSPVVSNITEVYGTEGVLFASSEATNPFQSVPLAVYTSKDYDWESLPEKLRNFRYPEEFWVTDLVEKPLRKRWVSLVPPREWAFTRMMEDFLDSIVSNREPRVSAADGAYVMEVLCGVFKSMETGTWVNLPLKEEVHPPFYAPETYSERIGG